MYMWGNLRLLEDFQFIKAQTCFDLLLTKIKTISDWIATHKTGKNAGERVQIVGKFFFKKRVKIRTTTPLHIYRMCVKAARNNNALRVIQRYSVQW